MQRLRPLLTVLTALLLPAPLSATWSIVVVDTATGEVGIASATCLNDFDLKEAAGVIVVGRGAGQAQALVDQGATNRLRIWNLLHNGKSATEILDFLEANDAIFHAHQYGIASLDPDFETLPNAAAADTATHTGSSNLDWASGVTGTSGTLHYAIQGNILTCEAVVTSAEAALRETRGDVGQRLMAAMWAARKLGGDGRCSCTDGPPTSCGCPPEEFNKGAKVGYLVVARIGDTDGVCNAFQGCANGDYYLDLNVTETPSPPPVKQLAKMHKEFRESWRGHADHLRSQKLVTGGPLPADGRSTASLELTLVDVHQNPVPFGGASIAVEHAEDSAGQSVIGAVTDHGDGTYSVPLTAGVQAGVDRFRVVVEDGMGPVTLFPFPELELVEPALVWEGGSTEEASFRLRGGVALAGRPFVLVAGANAAPESWIPLAFGALDGTGSARASFALPTVAYRRAAGGLRLAWIALEPAGFVSNVVELSPR